MPPLSFAIDIQSTIGVGGGTLLPTNFLSRAKEPRSPQQVALY